MRLKFMFATVGLICSCSLFAQTLDSRIESCNKIKNSKQRLGCLKGEVSPKQTPSKTVRIEAPKPLLLADAALICERLLVDLKSKHDLSSEDMSRTTDKVVAVSWPEKEGNVSYICFVDRSTRKVISIERNGVELSRNNLDNLERTASFREEVNNGKPSGYVRAAKEVLVRDFKDPASAQYRSVFIADPGFLLVLCGEVNAKNSYGAYVGFKRFYVTPEGGFRQVETDRDVRFPQIPTMFEGAWPRMCGNKVLDIVDN